MRYESTSRTCRGPGPCGRFRSHGRCGARGFTLLELVVALTLFALLASFGIPRAGEMIRISRVDRAARQVAVDLEQAMTNAARQRTSVRIEHPSSSLVIRTSDLGDGTVYSTTDLEVRGPIGVGVDGMRVEPAIVDVHATGRTSATLTVELWAGEHRRTVTMSQAGQVRVVTP